MRMKFAVACAMLLFLPAAAPASPDDTAPPSLARRAYIAARLYQAVQTDFAHWENVPPPYDFDAAFGAYLQAAMAARSRQDFVLATMRLMAGLQNDHTHFVDLDWTGKPSTTGFTARKLGDDWVVTGSSRVDLRAGDVIEGVDGQSVAAFARGMFAFMQRTNAREKELSVFGPAPDDRLLPSRFTLTLRGGRHVGIDRANPPHMPASPRRTETDMRSDGVVVIRIPSFGEPAFEADALKAVRDHRNASAIVFDVRGNDGGATPSDLLAAIMTTPYRGMIDQTPMHVGLYDARAALGDADAPLVGAMLRVPGAVVQPDHPIFAGRIVVVDDAYCVSACEDFVASIRSAKRGTIFGEPSFGSTGQPVIIRFAQEHMLLAVGADREFFPDGAPFEGVGVSPDVTALPNAEGLRQGKDEVLSRAVAAARLPHTE